MSGTRIIFVLAAISAMAAMLVGCATQSRTLNAAWPAQPGEYTKVRDAWTRQAVLRTTYQQTLLVKALPNAAPVRAAKTAADGKARGLAPEAVAQALTAAQATPTTLELQLRVTTWDPEENDLHRGEQAVWHLELVDGAGQRYVPHEVRRDLRPLQALDAELPAGSDFSRAYTVKFPWPADEGNNKWTLRVYGVRGGTELAWQWR